VTEREIKKGIKELSPIDVYMLLPRTNCKECGEANCMAFATKVVNREVSIELCPPLLEKKYEKAYGKLREIMAPAVKEITIGTGNHAVKVGGKLVLYRHEFTYHNPTPIAIEVTDEMAEDELLDKTKKADEFSYNYIGREVNLDMIAIRSTSNDPTTFKSAVEKVAKITSYRSYYARLLPTLWKLV